MYNNHFNPNQPRAKDGKWIDGPQSIESKISENIDVQREAQLQSYKNILKDKLDSINEKEKLEVSFDGSYNAMGWKKKDIIDYMADPEFKIHPIVFVKAGGKVVIPEWLYYRSVK